MILTGLVSLCFEELNIENLAISHAEKIFVLPGIQE